MNADQITLLFVVVALTAIALYYAFAAVPGIAHDRFIIRMSQARDEAEELRDRGLHDLEDEVVTRVDLLSATLIRSGAPGFSFLLCAPLIVRQRRKSGPPRSAEVRREMLTSPACRHAREIDNLERRVVREALRASLMGSKFWLALWPAWLYLKFQLADQEAPLTRAERRAESAVESALQVQRRVTIDRLDGLLAA
ncbi:hypothetical protein CWIS_13520 [Cellulomonas sp. A375-1]|uniref:hypothetical protein n=1 Tax=Cellulomonas sp. A375-1 TaxID=1672219 RepID=UPI0006526A22|nr:hypothetical protein [Cellulomonas sp. A375-1]KMM44848.1 hypothetical protein CWIS_13520 [Cellulomonas sp. A375-1]